MTDQATAKIQAITPVDRGDLWDPSWWYCRERLLLRLFYVASTLLPKCFHLVVDPSRQTLAQRAKRAPRTHASLHIHIPPQPQRLIASLHPGRDAAPIIAHRSFYASSIAPFIIGAADSPRCLVSLKVKRTLKSSTSRRS